MKPGHDPIPPSREEWIVTGAMIVCLLITILLLGGHS
jgi:hypothetical protein